MSIGQFGSSEICEGPLSTLQHFQQKTQRISKHYPVDKVVGAGSQDTVPSMQGCSGESCPSGDQTDPKHNKHRCPAGSLVTGIVSHSGDWLDSVEYVCSQMHVFNSE